VSRQQVADGDTERGASDPPRRRIATNTAIFTIATALSRVVGLAREVIAASIFGIYGPASAFTIASQVPNLMANLFAQAALSAAFVPVFTELLQAGKKREAFKLASTLFWIILVVLGVICALGIVFAGVIMPLFTGSLFAARSSPRRTRCSRSGWRRSCSRSS